MEKEIKITELDYIRLSRLVSSAKSEKKTEIENLNALVHEIDRAEKVDSKSIEPEFVTMNSVLKVFNSSIAKLMTIKIVYPNDADYKKGYISILSPLGSALIGYKVGDTVQFDAPKGKVEISIRSIDYQPESEGEYLV